MKRCERRARLTRADAIQRTAFEPPMDGARDLLTANGWQEQDIPGLWRHPWKANCVELGTTAALRANAEATHAIHTHEVEPASFMLPTDDLVDDVGDE